MSETKIWYLPHPTELEARGPFSLEEIQEMIELGDLVYDDYIWNTNLEDKWARVFELAEFSSYLKDYPKCFLPKKKSAGRASQVVKVNCTHEGKGEYGTENKYRRYPRAPIEGKVIIHNQNHYREANCIDVSEKGLLFALMDLSAFKPGEQVVITIFDHYFLNTFSIESVIVNNIEKNGIKGQGVYFLRVPPQVRKTIAEYVVHKLNKSELTAETA